VEGRPLTYHGSPAGRRPQPGRTVELLRLGPGGDYVRSVYGTVDAIPNDYPCERSAAVAVVSVLVVCAFLVGVGFGLAL
jgi:hypothetical protein